MNILNNILSNDWERMRISLYRMKLLDKLGLDSILWYYYDNKLW